MGINLITEAGYRSLIDELDWLWREERPEITRKVSWAASLGDRSENADYQYNKKRLREIDRRVRYLRKRIEDLRVVPYSPAQENKIYFGAWVTIANEEDESKKFRIVGADEIYHQKDFISIDSPMARACIGKIVGDGIMVSTPNGSAYWDVLDIQYNAVEAASRFSRP